MDANLLGEDVHNINILTVIANESYDSFARGLQSEIAEAVADRPRKVTVDLFKGKVIKDVNGVEQVVDEDLAQSIYEGLIANGYVKKGVLTEKYYADKKNGTLEIAEEAADCKDDVIAILDSIYAPLKLDNARSSNVEATLDRKKLESREFQALWAKINAKSAYMVKFNEDELVDKVIAALNRELRVSQIFIRVEGGALHDITSRENLLSGSAMNREESKTYTVDAAASASVKYDLIGKIVAETGLTRKAAADILSGMEKSVFDQFKNNPEEFIIRASGIINEQKATVIIQHITYDKLESSYDTTVFTEPTLKGRLGVNAMPANKHLYDYIFYDSDNEQKFAANIDSASEVAVYVKLPRGFYINTPVGKYNPDWAIAFHEEKVKHIYFVAETKGSMSSMQLRKIKEAKIHCAREHFKVISSDSVIYDVVDSYETLMNLVMR